MREQVMSQLITREYKGITFLFREDGYFNMTKAAKSFGKRLDNFFANADTQDYLRGLEEIPGIPGNTSTPWLKQCQTLN